MIKKVFVFVITLLLFSAFTSGVANAEKAYTDLNESDPNYVAIQYLSLDEVGVFEGYDDGSFGPEKEINRAELMKVLVESVYGTPDEDEYKNCYPDVGEDWYAKYVCYATEQGWVAGYPDGDFLPGNNVVKVEAVKMIINAYGFSGELPDEVSDWMYADTDNTQWYAPYVYLAKQYNLLEEIGAYYEPSNGMDRSGVAEMIFRIQAVLNSGADSYTKESRDELLNDYGLADLISEKTMIIADSYEMNSDGSIYIDSYHEDEDGVFSLESFADAAEIFVADYYSVSDGVIVVDEYTADYDEYVNLVDYEDRSDEWVVVLVVRDGEAVTFDEIQAEENPVYVEPAGAILGTLTTTNSVGRTGSYYLPEGYNLEEKPLLVVYHGTNGDGLQMLNYFVDLAEEKSFIIVAPDSRISPNGDYTWEVGSSPGEVTEDYTHMTNCIVEVAAISGVSFDDDFVMAAGFSGGASSAPYYATRENWFTHFAILHGGVFTGGMGDNIIPGWLSTGDSDTLRTPDMFEGYVIDLEDAGYTDLTYNVYSEGHELIDQELRELVEWWLK